MQHLEDEAVRKKEMVSLEQVLTIVKNTFNDIHIQMASRKREEQMIIGDLVTVLEMSIKHEIKDLKTK
jgi:hypothetical protein